MFYTLVCLAECPEWEERVVRELSEVNVDSPEEPILPLTEACLKEGMRVKPVGPVVIRRALHGGHT